MPTVADVLRDKVALDIESVDRVYLNGYVKDLQVPGSLVLFIRSQKGWAIPSPRALEVATEAFHIAVERYAADHGLQIVTFARGDCKEEVAQAVLARCPTKTGVILIGKAQESSTSFKSRRADRGDKVWFIYSRCRV